ncbi:unnamed protein product [Orchesella dallaii]|uniref:Transmembrane protein n=1 Tax=Orchesella dallaii TaxID=48710 RepID=A0ABP1QGT2_9HEXA
MFVKTCRQTHLIFILFQQDSNPTTSPPPPQIHNKSDRQKTSWLLERWAFRIPARVLGLLGLAIGGLSLGVLNLVDTHSNDEIKKAIELGRIIIIISMIITGLFIVVSFGLLIGAIQKNTCLCKAWIVMSVVSIIVSITDAVSSMSTVAKTRPGHIEIDLTPLFTAGVNIAIQLYCIWVVLAFIQQVKQVGLGETNSNGELGGQPGEGAQPQPTYQLQYPSQQASIAQSNNQ